MKSNQIPNFIPKNIIRNITQLTENGLKHSELASKGEDWHNVVDLLDESEHLIGREMSVNSHLNAVMFSESFNEEYEKTLPIISNYYSEIGANKSLYNAFKRLKKSSLNEQQKHIVKDSIKSFELSGVGLDGEDLARFKAIQEQLSVLSNQFSKNVLQATNSWKKTVTIDDLKGYGEAELSKVKKGVEYVVNLQIPVYIDLMTYAENRNLREEVYRAYISRASDIGITSKEFDNHDVMKNILELRSELSKLLDFSNYAELSIKSKMVESPEAVIEFLEKLVEYSRSQAQIELVELKSLSGHELMPWDLMYYSEKLKQKKFSYKRSDLTPYFPEDGVLNGLFSTIERLYGILLVEIKEDTYHPDVKVLELKDKTGVIGRIYLDVYSRENKRGGAWMSDYQSLYKDNLPIAFVVCNLNTPTEGKPALFEFDEIVTLFHEFGHALHHLLTKVPFPCAAGISGVPWDGVELPSQYMEFFCYERGVVDSISSHWKTGEKLPDDLFNKVVASKNFQSGLQMLRQCEFALWDINTHISDLDTYKILDMVREKTSLIPIINENRFLNSFSHIFSGGYAAGYFSYKWAEVLAADAYDFVKNDGGIGSKSALHFRECILEVGGSLDFMQQYIKFRGGKPKIEGLLKASGIALNHS
jgi:oligopeptidase A